MHLQTTADQFNLSTTIPNDAVLDLIQFKIQKKLLKKARQKEQKLVDKRRIEDVS